MPVLVFVTWFTLRFTSSIFFPHSLVVKDKCRLYQVVYFLAWWLTLIFYSLNCSQDSNLGNAIHSPARSPFLKGGLTTQFFPEAGSWLDVPPLQIKDLQNQVFSQVSSFIFQEHLLGLLFVSDVMWRNRKRCCFEYSLMETKRFLMNCKVNT